MKFFVNDSCIGCGFCAGSCPEVFTMRGTGTARAKDEEVAPEKLKSAEEAMNGCPVGAIEPRE